MCENTPSSPTHPYLLSTLMILLHCHCSIFQCTFFTILSNFLSSFFHFTLMTHGQWRQDIRNHHIVTVKTQSQNYCTQDGHNIRWTTASTFHLFYNHWTLKGHVILLQSPICNQLCHCSLFQHTLFIILSNLTLFLLFHTLMAHEQQRQDTRNHCIVIVKIWSQDYCIQDRPNIG